MNRNFDAIDLTFGNRDSGTVAGYVLKDCVKRIAERTQRGIEAVGLAPF